MTRFPLSSRDFRFRSFSKRRKEEGKKKGRKKWREKSGEWKDTEPRFNGGFVSPRNVFVNSNWSSSKRLRPLPSPSPSPSHNRTTSNTRCSILSCPSPSRRTFLSTAATTTRRKPIRDRHPAERQRLLVYPRSHVKMGSRSSVTQTETECNEAGDGTLFPRHFVPSLCVYIRFGIYFIYHSRLSLRGLSLSLSLTWYVDTAVRWRWGKEILNTKEKEERTGRERETLQRDPRRLIRRDSVYHTAARSACLPDCSIFLHTYLNYWNCSITIFHWFIDASSRFFLSFFLLSFSRGAFSLCSFLYCFFLAWLRLFLIEKEEPLGVFVYKKLIKIKNLKEILFVAFWKEWRF